MAFFGFAGHWRQRRGCISSGGWYFCLCCNTDVWHSWNQEEAHQSQVEGHVGRGICKNCGHDAYMTLCRHLNQGALFWIPVVNIEKERGIMCESCGYIYPMDRQEYKEARDKVKKAIDK
jgi:DNA-directed RNA polymerase subunit RPC12/RpoP